MSSKIYTVYCMTNLINDKKYIGYTSQTPQARLTQHLNGTIENKFGKLLYHAMRKYGNENFSFDIIYQSYDRDHCLDMETYFIIEHKTFVDLPDAHGYNLDTGGKQPKKSKKTVEQHKAKMKGKKKPEGFGAKISAATKGENNPMYGLFGKDNPQYGMKRTDEQCKNISEGRKNNPTIYTEEMRINKSNSLKQAWKEGKFDNRPEVTEETRKKLSDSQKGHPAYENQVKAARKANMTKYVVELESGGTQVIEGLADFAESIGLSPTQLYYTMTSNRFNKGYRIIERLGKNCKL